MISFDSERTCDLVSTFLCDRYARKSRFQQVVPLKSLRWAKFNKRTLSRWEQLCVGIKRPLWNACWFRWVQCGFCWMNPNTKLNIRKKPRFHAVSAEKTMNMIFVTFRCANLEFSHNRSRKSIQVWLQFMEGYPTNKNHAIFHRALFLIFVYHLTWVLRKIDETSNHLKETMSKLQKSSVYKVDIPLSYSSSWVLFILSCFIVAMLRRAVAR